VAALNRSLHYDPARATEELETDLLLEALFQRFGFDFRQYERTALTARIHAVMAGHALATVSQLQDRALHDPQVRSALLRALGVQPAALFDDPQQARQLRAVLAPSLRGAALPRIWLAESAGVEEAWSLAILLADEGLSARTEIYATVSCDEALADIGQSSIALERLEEYQENYMKGGGVANLADYFDLHGKRAVLKAPLRKRITWAQYNLVTDASFNEFQLIVCRRALADFGPVLRQKTLRLFHDSLALFGVLGLDRELDDADPLHAHYTPVFAHQPWYKRTS
jgi:chemotaxis protein methyltransferase CheR